MPLRLLPEQFLVAYLAGRSIRACAPGAGSCGRASSAHAQCPGPPQKFSLSTRTMPGGACCSSGALGVSSVSMGCSLPSSTPSSRFAGSSTACGALVEGFRICHTRNITWQHLSEAGSQAVLAL